MLMIHLKVIHVMSMGEIQAAAPHILIHICLDANLDAKSMKRDY